MTACDLHEAGAVELFFYGELGAGESAAFQQHLQRCRVCAEALCELDVIRASLATRPDVSAPPADDWSGFMHRLDAVIAPTAARRGVTFSARKPRLQQPLIGLLATAALLAIVSLSVFMASRSGRAVVEPVTREAAPVSGVAADAVPLQAGLTSVGLKHLERSKLVVLGLATKEAEIAGGDDWTYERELASSLLNDTRLYRFAAEQRGLTALAGVMKDLELVLLQASMAETTDRSALPQIQRLIEKRGLVQKMDVVATTGMVP